MKAETKQKLQTIKDDLPALLRARGIDTGRPFTCLNPEHTDHNPSMTMYTDKNGTPRIKCHACGCNWSAIDLLAVEAGIDPANTQEATANALKEYNMEEVNTITRPVAKAQVKAVEQVQEAPAPVAIDFTEWQKNLEANGFAYPTSRGLSIAICKRFGLGYGRANGLAKALVIPTSESTYVARNTDPEADKKDRYRNKGKAQLYPAECLDAEGTIFIVEGELDALAIIDAGFNAVALGGCSNTHLLVERMKGSSAKLVVMCDPDDAGEKATAEIMKGIEDAIPARLSEEYKDASEFWQNDKAGMQARLQELEELADKKPANRWNGLDMLTEADFFTTNDKGVKVKNTDNTDKMRKIKQAVLSQLRYVADTVCLPVTQRNRPTLYKPFDTASCSLTIDKFCEYCKVPTMDKATEIKDVKTKVDGMFMEIPKPEQIQNPALCLFKNGVVNILEPAEARPVNEETFTNYIPHDFKMNPEPVALVDDFMKAITLEDAEAENLIYEMIGACLYGKLEFRTMFLLTGQRASGKSTLQRFLIYLLGIDNVSTLKLEDLSERFNRVDLFGKLAIIGDDIDTKYLKNVSFAKSIIAGEMVRGEYKGKDGFSFRNIALPIFSANGKPSFSDDGNAMSSRTCIIECLADFMKNPDARMSEKLCTEACAQYAIWRGAKAYAVAHRNGGFSIGAKATQAKKVFEKELNPLRTWLVDEWFSLTDGNPNDFRMDALYEGRQADRELYMEYNKWLATTGLQQRSERRFREELKDVVGTFTRASKCRQSPVQGMEWRLNGQNITEPVEARYIKLDSGEIMMDMIQSYAVFPEQNDENEHQETQTPQAIDFTRKPVAVPPQRKVVEYNESLLDGWDEYKDRIEF